jgi:hypothetical protein
MHWFPLPLAAVLARRVAWHYIALGIGAHRLCDQCTGHALSDEQPAMTSGLNRREFLTTSASAAGSLALMGNVAATPARADDPKPKRPYQVGAYYFPNYRVDPRNEKRYGPGWTEWELIKQAKPRFPGHRQPRVPAWGYVDEADPKLMEQKIAAAADHGLDYWIFDWYWDRL